MEICGFWTQTSILIQFPYSNSFHPRSHPPRSATHFKCNKQKTSIQQINTKPQKKMHEELKDEITKLQQVITPDCSYTDEIDRILGDALGKCLNHYKDEKIGKCENSFSDFIFPVLEKRGRSLKDAVGYLSICLASKDKAYICAENGLKKGSNMMDNGDKENAKSLLN